MSCWWTCFYGDQYNRGLRRLPTVRRLLLLSVGFIAAAHLLDLGHRKLGFIGAVESSLAVDERLEGFDRPPITFTISRAGLVRLVPGSQPPGTE